MYNTYILQRDVKKINSPNLKSKEVASYLFFGVCTTLINWISYYILYNMCYVSNVVSTIIAWALAVAFAFFTNKKWVFESKSYSAKTVFKESASFILSRVFTGVLDVAIMWVAVDLLSLGEMLSKVGATAIVFFYNFLVRKLLIYKKR